MSVAAGDGRINVRRNVTAGSLLDVGGAPKRRASTLLIMNESIDTPGTAVVSGDDGVEYTVDVPVSSTVEMCGDFETLGTLTGVSVIAGWVDDGSVQRNG